MAQADAFGSVPWYRTLNREQWKVLLASNLGWLFDGFEIYALFLTVGFALHQLLEASQYSQIPRYAGYVLFGGALYPGESSDDSINRLDVKTGRRVELSCNLEERSCAIEPYIGPLPLAGRAGPGASRREPPACVPPVRQRDIRAKYLIFLDSHSACSGSAARRTQIGNSSRH